MMIFDASNRDQCEVARTRTNTPLQALVMMNDPTVLEASLALADGLVQKAPAPETAINKDFNGFFAVRRRKKNWTFYTAYWKDQQAFYKKDLKAAEKLLHVGTYKPQTSSKADLAALMQVMQVIYNMEEAITKT
jgi:hypothetical protein